MNNNTHCQIGLKTKTQHRNYTMLYLLKELLFIVTFLSRQSFNQKDFELLNTTEFYAHS